MIGLGQGVMGSHLFVLCKDMDMEIDICLYIFIRTRSPSRCLANDQVDDFHLLTGIVRVHVGRVESNIAGIQRYL